ncbi:hypothetical protein [Rhizobium azibense]|uniref:Dehydrogenase n=1 Tax=Rhizobium azibense TaxID=1136135 RepID=A0A4R3RE42_9HYPH|nr:hypothetical protein [Rhizobium azibense]TCU32794.1 hypothetical protein EV129_11816 [Rhizobium azibense]
MVTMELMIIGFGPVADFKYSRCIREAINQGYMQTFRVIDRESQKDKVEDRLTKLPIRPVARTYIPEEVLQHGPDAGIKWLVDCGVLIAHNGRGTKLVITTEPQSHEAYIKYGLAAQFDVLVAKPLVLPTKNGVLDRSSFMPSVKAIAEASTDSNRHTAILCLGRLHEIYERRLRQPAAMMVDRLQMPITSAHVKTASGVWNLPYEFAEREDHPYKYGYGMLMHGAYHYIDNLARLLLVNRRIYPDDELTLTLRGFSAGPHDQHSRIPERINELTAGYNGRYSTLAGGLSYGETDVVASFALKFRKTGLVLTLGTISLEQTTPGMRSWGPFPEVPYNINGRLHCTDIDVRLGPVFGIAARVTKHPIGARMGDADIRGINSATVVTRSNARLARTQGFIRTEHFERPYGNSYSYSAEAEVFRRWLLNEPTYSDFASHVPSCAVLDGLLKLVACGGNDDVTFDFNYSEPHWPVLQESDDPWYAYMGDDVAFSAKH